MSEARRRLAAMMLGASIMAGVLAILIGSSILLVTFVYLVERAR